MLNWLLKRLHIHRWKTTHTNKWMHPTREECRCGLVREFKFKEGYRNMPGMPWEKGDWVYSDGTVNDYKTHTPKV